MLAAGKADAEVRGASGQLPAGALAALLEVINSSAVQLPRREQGKSEGDL